MIKNTILKKVSLVGVILSSLVFLFNIFYINNVDAIVYSNAQQKIIRDTKRLNDITILKRAIDDYYNANKRYPVLTSGFNVPGYVNSTSKNEWSDFCNILDISDCPLDPINTMDNCSCSSFIITGSSNPNNQSCSGLNVDKNIDKTTCFNSVTGQLACTTGSKIYQYQVFNNGASYKLSMQFEYNDGMPWNVNLSSANSAIVTSGSCNSGTGTALVMSGKSVNPNVSIPKFCGNGIVDSGEVCDRNTKYEFCTTNFNESGVKVIPCDSSCKWGTAGTCVAGSYCGDGVTQYCQDSSGKNYTLYSDCYDGDGNKTINNYTTLEDCDGGIEKMCFNFYDTGLGAGVGVDKYLSKHSWYNERIRSCNNACKYDGPVITNIDFCGGYCGDGVLQSDKGEECDLGPYFALKYSNKLQKYLSCSDRKKDPINPTDPNDDTACEYVLGGDSNCVFDVANNVCKSVISFGNDKDKHCDMTSCIYKNTPPKLTFDFLDNVVSNDSYIKSSVYSGANMEYSSDYFGDGTSDLIVATIKNGKPVAIWNSDFIEIKVKGSDNDDSNLVYKYNLSKAFNPSIKIKYKNASNNFVDYTTDSYVSSDTIRIYPTTSTLYTNNAVCTNAQGQKTCGNYLFNKNYIGAYILSVSINDNNSLGKESDINFFNATDSLNIPFDIGSGCGDRILDSDEQCEFRPGSYTKNIYVNFIDKTFSANNVVLDTVNGLWKYQSTSSLGLCEKRKVKGACASGWIVGSNDNCYRVTSGSVSWVNAKTECELQDSYLAVIDDYEENIFLKTKFSTAPTNFPTLWLGYYKDVDGYYKTLVGGKWDPALDNSNPFLLSLFGGGKGNSKVDQYSCGIPWEYNSCQDTKGYCGDGNQANFKGCDAVSYTQPSPANSSVVKQYACNGCNVFGGFCGDGTVQSGFGEQCESDLDLTNTAVQFCGSCSKLDCSTLSNINIAKVYVTRNNMVVGIYDDIVSAFGNSANNDVIFIGGGLSDLSSGYFLDLSARNITVNACSSATWSWN